jgi:hypothetical protein
MSSYFSVESHEEEERYKREAFTVVACKSCGISIEGDHFDGCTKMPPRLITAAEVLEERKALRSELSSVPHGTGRGWSSYFWVSCDCPNCRDNYDPTGEECAKYLNMDSTSFFRGQSEAPSFAFSKIAKESFLAYATPGFYLKETRLTVDELLTQLTPSTSTILRIGEDGTWDEFILNGNAWKRRTYKKGRSVYYKEEENPSIPSGELVQRLHEL